MVRRRCSLGTLAQIFRHADHGGDAGGVIVGAFEPAVAMRDHDYVFIGHAGQRAPDGRGLEIGDALDIQLDLDVRFAGAGLAR